MTLNECRNATALLGFADSLNELDDTSEAAFRAALNRAIWEVDAIRPREGIVTLYHYPPVNRVGRTEWYHMASRADTVCAIGDAYAFAVTGSGTCVVTNGFDVVEHTWQNESLPRSFGGRMSGVLELTFSGNSNYFVRGVSVWEGETFSREEVIPIWEPYISYDITQYAEDAYSILCPPKVMTTLGYFPLREGYGKEGRTTLTLDTKAPGTYQVKYHRMPPQIEEDADYDNEIDLDEDLAQLLPLQIAYFLLLDDDPDKSALYLKEYKEQVYRLLSAEKRTGDTRYVSLNNW